jgi:2-oxopent-4-enoate/cis-2-oxohex-4-enoate hydratase
MNKAEHYGAELYAALRDRRTVPPLIARDPSLTVEDAYAISLDFLSRRRKDGEKVVGKKIGVTSKAVQDMLGVHQPDFGFLTDWMTVADGAEVKIAGHLIQPRAEAEIGFILKERLMGPGITPEQVLAATECVVPCFEIVDSRIDHWNIRIVDTVADNASCGVYVLGDARVDPRGLDLAALEVRVTKNGQPLSRGFGSAVQGSPLVAVAWLANTLGERGVALEAGEVILSGSLVPLEPARPGDVFALELDQVGTATVRFT